MNESETSCVTISTSVDGMLFASALESEEAYHMERCEAEE